MDLWSGDTTVAYYNNISVTACPGEPPALVSKDIELPNAGSTVQAGCDSTR